MNYDSVIFASNSRKIFNTISELRYVKLLPFLFCRGDDLLKPNKVLTNQQ